MAAKRKDWQAKVKGLLKAELKRRNLSYADLAEKLAAIGVKENERNISNKIGRGALRRSFSCSAWKLSAATPSILRTHR